MIILLQIIAAALILFAHYAIIWQIVKIAVDAACIKNTTIILRCINDNIGKLLENEKESGDNAKKG